MRGVRKKRNMIADKPKGLASVYLHRSGDIAKVDQL